MVNKTNYREIQGEPPPMDESWWEAILAEDEARSGRLAAKKSAQPGANSRLAALHPQKENLTLDWLRAMEMYTGDQVICLSVTGFNRGGLLVGGEGLQGFVPVSHLIDAPVEGVEPDLWLSNYMDRLLRLKIIECDQARGRVVFSERAALADPGTRNHLLQTLLPNECITGTVTNITDFGVFVDLGGVEGLVHVSEISWGRVPHPADVVSVGQQLRVFIIQIDRDRARVALSLKRLYPNPWETAQQRYYPGQVTEAVVTSIVPFGAFARLEEGLDGLIHISEMNNHGEAGDPGEALNEGQRVKVRVLQVDCTKQRLGLSLKLNPELDHLH
jgi:small subunit ribosomal protein S1